VTRAGECDVIIDRDILGAVVQEHYVKHVNVGHCGVRGAEALCGAVTGAVRVGVEGVAIREVVEVCFVEGVDHEVLSACKTRGLDFDLQVVGTGRSGVNGVVALGVQVHRICAV